MLTLLALLLVIAFVVWLVTQFTGPPVAARIALIVWVALATLMLTGIDLEA